MGHVGINRVQELIRMGAIVMNTYAIFVSKPWPPQITDNPALIEAETFVEAIYNIYSDYDVAQNQILAILLTIK